MKKLSGVIIKEFLVLLRDVPALLFLFIMPVVLLIVISVTEDKVSNQSRINLVIIGSDSSAIKKDIEKSLKKSDFFTLISINSVDQSVIQSTSQEIAKGKFQAGIIIPAEVSETMSARAEKIVALSITNPETVNDSLKSINGIANVIVIFDPAVKESVKYSLINALDGIFTGTEIKVMIEKYVASIGQDINLQFKTKMNALKEKNISIDIPDNDMKEEMNKQVRQSVDKLSKEDIKINIPKFPWQAQSLLRVKEEYPNNQRNEVLKPTISQICVPGFTLFAMFFIVMPLAGSIITERKEGAFNRLRTLPVSYFNLLMGKILVYIVICLLQFLFMMAIGFYILPRFFDMPALVIGSHYVAIFVTAIMSALAAIGFGLLVGTWATSQAQASTFGSLMVVILSILGGVFIPVYLMPDSIKAVSIISPLRWGIDSFIDLFVRNEGFSSIISNIARLFSFFMIALTLSLISFYRRN
jgi:ABC-2 type transport system permease protein